MSCNCVTNEQLKELYKKFGEEKNTTEREERQHFIKHTIEKTGVAISSVLLFPIIFCYAFYKGFFSKDRKISLSKFFNLKKENVREQQVI